MNDLNHLTDAELEQEMSWGSRRDSELYRLIDCPRDVEMTLIELTALRKLRKAVRKLVRGLHIGDEHPIDWQRVTTFLREAEKVEVSHVGDNPHV